MKSIPWSDISLGLGNGGGSFVAPRWNMIALVILSAHLSREKKRPMKATYHSLSKSKKLHGLLPVTICKTIHPKPQISQAPSLPVLWFLIISGAMYIGVPSRPSILACPPPRVRASVLLDLMILAVPKSASLRTELAPMRISCGR